MSQHWVFLADPTTYGWDDLEKEKRAVWDGVKNAAAQRNLKACSKGDEVLVYHTAPDKAVVGIARVTRAAYPDPASAERVVVDVQPVRALGRRLSLAELKSDDVLREMSFVKMPRVAVQKVTAAEWKRVVELSE